MMKLPFILSIPHCGVQVPGQLRSEMALSDHEIVESVDFGTYEIFSRIPALTIIHAQWSRLVADLNRNPLRRDEKGVVALSDYHGRRVFTPGCEPTPAQIEQRVAQYHHPYNAQLQQALNSSSFAVLFDCHSLNGTGPADAPDAGQKRKDITLSNFGDHEGKPRGNAGPITCPPDMLLTIARLFQQQGFSVSINNPYKGGFIINHYAPSLLETGRCAVQIEMNQDLYMHAGDVEPEPARIDEVTARVSEAFRSIADHIQGQEHHG
jgi:N-formylglutamate deformylase